MPLVSHQEGHPVYKNWAMGRWHSYLSGARCKLRFILHNPYMSWPYLPEANELVMCAFILDFAESYHCYTHDCFMALWILSGTTWVSHYQKKHSPTHTYHGHQSAIICFLHLLWSTASPLFNLHAWQSFSTISKISLVYLLAWHPPLHIPYISSPNHCLFLPHMPIS